MQEARFNLERRKDKNGNIITTNVPVRLSFFFPGGRLEYYTGIRITKATNFNNKYYKEGKPAIKANEPEAGRKNKLLKDLKTKVELEYDNAIALKIMVTAQYLKEKLDEEIKGKNAKSNTPTISEAFKKFIEETEAKKSKGTLDRIKTTYTHLENTFGKKFTKLTFDDLNTAFVEKFKSCFINGFQRKDGKHDFKHNTVIKYTRCLREFINWSADEKQQYHTAKINFGKVEEKEINIIYLNAAEIEQLSMTEMPTETLNKVKDVFLFGCYTGLRHSDIYKLKKKDVLNGGSIRFYIQKNNEAKWHTVPLVDQSLAIVEKYKNIRGDKALPVISNQKMNEYLKEVMKIAGFDELLTIREFKADGTIEEKEYHKYELITCHTSRKSFISYAVASGMPEIEIKAITGHSKNSRAFGRYYQISDEQKQKAMSKIFRKKKSSKLLRAV